MPKMSCRAYPIYDIHGLRLIFGEKRHTKQCRKANCIRLTPDFVLRHKKTPHKRGVAGEWGVSPASEYEKEI